MIHLPSTSLRICALMLSLLLLLPMVASCNTGKPDGATTEDTTAAVSPEEETTEQETEEETLPVETTYPVVEDGLLVKISEYILYRPTSSGTTISTAYNAFNDAVAKAAKTRFTVKIDKVSDSSKIDPDAFEILFGMTNRPESSEAMQGINGLGYVIKRIGNKIVINANANSLLIEAAEYFIDTFVLPTAGYGYFILPEDLNVVKDKVAGETLLDASGNCNFKMVYSHLLDTTEGPKPEGSSMNNRVDYVVRCTNTFHTTLTTYLKFDCRIGTDYIRPDKKPDSSVREILIGFTNRPETAEFLSKLSPTQYGFGLVGKKVVIAGWSDTTTEMALNLFINRIDKFLTVNAEGKKNLAFLNGDAVIESNANWNSEIPTYDGGTISAVMEGLGSCYEIYITETKAEEYTAYRRKLEADGYKLHQENQIGQNLFATYYNDVTMIHVYYVGRNSVVRIVTEPMKDCVLPQNEDPYTPLPGAEVTFTMVDLDNAAENFGNCFVITLLDGSFIVHDGGGDKGDDHITLYNVLKQLNRRTDGKIVIAAWILSHEHWDHFKNFYDVVLAHLDEITLERIIYNQPTSVITYNSGNPGGYISSGTMARFAQSTRAQLVKLHTGQTIQIRNLKIEAIYTQDDLCPNQIYHFNNGSLVTRFTTGGQTLTVLGDIEDVASEIMVSMYTEADIHTDFMTVAHHGSGGTTALYNLFKPTVVLWPTNQNHANNQLKASSTGYYPTINKALVNQKNVKLVVIADNGHKTITLPMKATSESGVKVWKDR